MLRIRAVALFACVLVTSVLTAQDARAPQPLALTHVILVDVRDGSLHRDQTVIIRGERITAVGTGGDTAVPDAARVLDGRGRYLIPGLWDMHVHSAAAIEWHFPLFVAHGVTGVRNLHTTVKAPVELTQSIKARLASGDLLGPRFVANGPIVDGEPPSWPAAVVVRRPADARAAVDALVEGGADFIKVYDNLSREAYLAIAEQAKRRDVPFLGHVPFAVRPEDAADAGHRTDEHMQGLESGCSSRADWVRAERRRVVDRGASASPIQTLVALFRLERALYDSREASLCTSTLQAYVRNGTMVVPNLVIHRNNQWPERVLSDSASMRFIPARARREWEERARPGPGDEIPRLMRPTWPQRLDNVRLLRNAGVRILAGTDLGNPLLVPGVSLHQELTLLVEAGLSPLEALQAATLNPARSLDKADSLGTIEPGKLADLVLLDANPLEDIGNTRKIAAVVLNGRYLDRRALDDLLASVERAANPQPDALVEAGLTSKARRFAAWRRTGPTIASSRHLGFCRRSRRRIASPSCSCRDRMTTRRRFPAVDTSSRSHRTDQASASRATRTGVASRRTSIASRDGGVPRPLEYSRQGDHSRTQRRTDRRQRHFFLAVCRLRRDAVFLDGFAFELTRSGSFFLPVSRFHSSKVSSEIFPFTSSCANFRRCAWLLKGIESSPSILLVPVSHRTDGGSHYRRSADGFDNQA